MKMRSMLTVAAVVLLGLASIPALGQDAETPAAELFNGTWRYAGSQAHGTQIISRAVDRCVEPMNFIIRGIAAGRLRDKNQLVRRIEVNVTGNNAHIDFDGRRSYRTPLGGWRNHTFGGDSIRVQIRENRGSLVQLFRSDSGTRRNVYRMMPNGQMRLEVTVQADSLERDMTYRLLYRR